jgi:hypothetical protein
VTLRCLAKGLFYSEAGDLHGISKSSVCVAMDRVLTSLCRRLDNIRFPTNEADLKTTKTAFHGLAGFPNVVGAVDGTLIKIQAPPVNEAAFVCRKGFHAFNVQAVADTNLRYIYRHYSLPLVNGLENGISTCRVVFEKLIPPTD